jgi:hypothetical protein
MDFIGLAFLNNGLKALIDYLSNSGSLFAFCPYVKSISAPTHKSLKNIVWAAPESPSAPPRSGAQRC